jgi:AbrB family looped-hinge helix DNA binding protein
MVRLQVKLGPKGQVLIPKVLRDQFRLYANQNVIIEETEQGVLIKSCAESAYDKILKLAAEAKNGKTYVYDKKELEERYDLS